MKPEAEVLVQSLQRQLGADGSTVERIETPSAWVLLAGDEAWKIKKPVRLGFLDFGTLQRRRHFCEEELRLNRRHAPTLYRGVVPISGTPQAPQLGGAGPAIEYALHMRRFPPRALLSEQLADGRLVPAHLDRLALHLAALHAQADVAPAGSPWGGADELAGQTRALLRRLAARGAVVADLQTWLDEQLPKLVPLWQQRQQMGSVRECHGDLHLRNAVVLGDEVLAFDGLEFDPALRWIDVCADMAFMAMDLLAHARPALAWRFVNAWLDASGDHAGVPLLRFYLVERALVRALVGLLGAPAPAPEPSATQYLALARQLALAPPRPRLLVTHGLSGSGKTWLTQALLEPTGALRLRADVERKRLFGLGALEASAAQVPGGIYGAQANERTYAQLAARARLLLGAGYPVIIDAACLRHAERQRLCALAADCGAPFTLLDCQADAQTLRERVRARAARRDDASEADEAVLAMQAGVDEPLTAAERAQAIMVRTDQGPDVAALAARWLAAGAPGA